MYKGWNVHDYSTEWSPLVAKKLTRPLSDLRSENLLQVIRGAGLVLPPLLQSRVRLHDPMLGNVHMGRLLLRLWKLCRVDADHRSLLQTTFTEMSTTCVEGYSHRLFALYATLVQ